MNYDIEEIRLLVLGAVNKYQDLSVTTNNPYYEIDDLVQVGMENVLKHIHKFDETKAKLSTFVYIYARAGFQSITRKFIAHGHKKQIIFETVSLNKKLTNEKNEGVEHEFGETMVEYDIETPEDFVIKTERMQKHAENYSLLKNIGKELHKYGEDIIEVLVGNMTTKEIALKNGVSRQAMDNHKQTFKYRLKKELRKRQNLVLEAYS